MVHDYRIVEINQHFKRALCFQRTCAEIVRLYFCAVHREVVHLVSITKRFFWRARRSKDSQRHRQMYVKEIADFFSDLRRSNVFASEVGKGHDIRERDPTPETGRPDHGRGDSGIRTPGCKKCASHTLH